MKLIIFALVSWLTICYADAVLCEELCNEEVLVNQIQKTRYGDANLVAIECFPPDAIMFNGRKVFDGQGMYVRIFGYFQVGNSDVILVGSNPGGSATPETAMFFLIISSKSVTHVLSDPKFVAVSSDDIKARMDKDGRVYVKLGFREGNEAVAELISGKLVLKSIPSKGHSMGSDSCQHLFEVGAEVCSSEFSRKGGCGDYVSNAGEVGVIGSNAAMGSFQYSSNKPGFIKSGFSKSCLAWCKGNNVTYRDFGKETCGIQNAERSMYTEDCKELYAAGQRACASQIARENCGTYVVAENGAFPALDVNDQNTLNQTQRLPETIQLDFKKSCFAWCDGKTVSYTEFRKAVCRIK